MIVFNPTLVNQTDTVYELEKNLNASVLTSVLNDKTGLYINEKKLFVALFNCFPNFILKVDINFKTAHLWFLENYESAIKENYYYKRDHRRSKHAEIDTIFYILFEDLIIKFDSDFENVCFLFRKTDLSKIEEIIAGLQKFKKRKRIQKPEIYLLVNGTNGIETKLLYITKPKLSIEHNYNDDFIEIHRTIFKRLSRINDKGLVLLHGKPGTGKTSYIRFLIASLKKNVIFLPPNMAMAITNPNFISILVDNPNSIFVIEDAENIVVDREQDGNSPVSALLNISDGLLADCLNVQIICSFNTDISKIDSALMRKGRLIAKYEFKELEIEKAQQLSYSLGFKATINKPMNLTSIYNQDEKDFHQSKKSIPIGFQTIAGFK